MRGALKQEAGALHSRTIENKITAEKRTRASGFVLIASLSHATD